MLNGLTIYSLEYMKDCTMNYNELIEHVSKQEGVSITTDPSRWNLNTHGYSEIYQLWQKANFNPNSIKWINYYPEIHYDKSIETELCNSLGIVAHRSWISRIDPGYYAPWHWDVDDNEQLYLSKGQIVRYSCFIEEPSMGHVFILGDKYLYNIPQGTIVKWDNYKEWHCGMNGGLVPKYMLHILGY